MLLGGGYYFLVELLVARELCVQGCLQFVDEGSVVLCLLL